MKRRIDRSLALYECYLFVRQHPEYHSALPIVASLAISSGVHLLGNMIEYSQFFSDDCFKIKANQIISIPIPQGYHLFSFGIKIQLFILRISPGMYRMIRLVYNRVIHVTNRLKITDIHFIQI